MIIRTDTDVTAAVLSAMEGGSSARLTGVMHVFIPHLHDFVRSIEPSDREFEACFGFIEALGRVSTSRHSEVLSLLAAIGFEAAKVLPTSGALEPGGAAHDFMEAAEKPGRHRNIAELAVRHLDAFAENLAITDKELALAARFVEAVGRANTSSHNEVVLMLDALGVSTLVGMVGDNRSHTGEATALLGPFYRGGAPDYDNGASIVLTPDGSPPMMVTGHVTSLDGSPLAGATVDVWHASPKGLYDNQDEAQERMNLRGKFTTDASGQYALKTIRPSAYPVPTHGPVGDLLRLQERHPFRPTHVHFIVSAPGHRTLITQVFDAHCEYLESDVVFGVKQRLACPYERYDTVDEERFPGMTPPFFSLSADFVLEPGTPSFPTPPID